MHAAAVRRTAQENSASIGDEGMYKFVAVVDRPQSKLESSARRNPKWSRA